MDIGHLDRYLRSGHTNGSMALCDNDHHVNREVADTALLAGIQDNLLDPKILPRMQKDIWDLLKQKPRKSALPKL